MTTSTIELINSHVSVRTYRNDPVPAETIERIVAAAQHSSTSANLQMTTVVAVTDPAKRKRLAELCGSNQQHINEAPAFLAWCADLNRLGRVCELRNYKQITKYVENFLMATVDATIASQTAALAAESLGLGICYIGSIRNNPREIIALLALPRLVFPIMGMTVGWPAAKPRVRPRLATSAVLHWETYHQDQDQALHDYDRTMIETGIYKGRQVPVPGKPGEMEEYGWLEESARRISQPHRTNLRHVLSDQGFDLK
ncbi:MAG: NADPH-dependent oxidoreductase [Candidatus Bathyarchaeia archaeon]|jgi:FMN reductase (NADPH)